MIQIESKTSTISNPAFKTGANIMQYNIFQEAALEFKVTILLHIESNIPGSKLVN
jgi:hypothetical protein